MSAFHTLQLACTYAFLSARLIFLKDREMLCTCRNKNVPDKYLDIHFQKKTTIFVP